MSRSLKKFRGIAIGEKVTQKFEDEPVYTVIKIKKEMPSDNVSFLCVDYWGHNVWFDYRLIKKVL